jgi:rod shape-determining protein MreC
LVLAFLQRNRGLLVVGALLLFPLLLLYAQSKRPAARGPLIGVLVDMSAGIERVLLWSTGGISDALESYVTLRDNHAEIARLRRQQPSVLALQAEVSELSHENDRLRALARIATTLDGPVPVGARVIGRAGVPVARTLRIDRGSRDGIKRGDGVVGKDGVVGVVLSAGSFASEVLLITHASAALDVLVQRTRAHGLLRGIGEADRYACEVNNFDRLSDVKAGDVLVTAGLAARFPRGVVVGTVASVATNERALTLAAVVRPAVDVAALEEVLVLVQRPMELPKSLGDDPDTPQSSAGPRSGRTRKTSAAPPPTVARDSKPVAEVVDAGPRVPIVEPTADAGTPDSSVIGKPVIDPVIDAGPTPPVVIETRDGGPKPGVTTTDAPTADDQ